MTIQFCSTRAVLVLESWLLFLYFKPMKNSKLLQIALLLASMLTMLANAVIAPSLALISQAFSQVENVEILTKLMMTLPALTIAIVSPVAGRLLDKIGRIKVLFTSLIIYLFAGTSGYWLGDLYLILVGRFVLGLGVAGIMTATTTLVGDYFTGAKREQFMGLRGAFVAIGGLLFITVSGALADIDWRLSFLVYGFSIFIIVLVPFALHEPEVAAKAGPSNAAPISVAVPKTVWLVFASAFMTAVFFYIIPVQLPFLLQNLGNVSGNEVGLALGSLPFAQAISSLSYKKVKAKLSYTAIYGLGFIPTAIGFFIIGASHEYWQVVAGVLFCGFGIGLLMPNGQLWMIDLAPLQVRGKYVGFLTTFAFFGMFLSPLVIQPIQDALGMSLSFYMLGGTLTILSILYCIGQKYVPANRS